MKTIYAAYSEACMGINIKENENIVLESKDPKCCYWFARDIPEANIKAHQEVVMKSKNGWNCFMFATNVENSNKEELFKVVLEYGDKGCINAFLKNIDFDKDKFKIYLLFI